jgi:hypothetical protein
MKQHTVINELIGELHELTQDLDLDPLFRAGIQACIAKARMKIEKERQQLISFGYTQIQYVDAEIGDCICKKVPEEIYNETYGG